MPADPLELERARDRLVQLVGLHREASMREDGVPRIGEESWRGPAYVFYCARVDTLTQRLRAATAELGEAVSVARWELLDAAG